ncbi:hypothetical protein [Streptacidiphilus sp. EB129]|uniref:hypothetical protein n=1 Tax=Streptacidiphilus sp. EB129 TaxID=3156262 RepID=UPI003514EDEA
MAHDGPCQGACKPTGTAQLNSRPLLDGPVTAGEGSLVAAYLAVSGTGHNGPGHPDAGEPVGAEMFSAPTAPSDARGRRGVDSVDLYATPLYYAMAARWESAGRTVPGVPDPEWHWLVATGPGRRRRLPALWVPQQRAWSH